MKKVNEPEVTNETQKTTETAKELLFYGIPEAGHRALVSYLENRRLSEPDHQTGSQLLQLIRKAQPIRITQSEDAEPSDS